ncbi:GLPGLI family protein [Polaribacter glomeratus]|uniref:GLPGLI family protein n=1 Tax=Polaribacter glomeratus TaxID=102 RepID=A0A2S7WGG7_9FLAO|nr:GLPGLI family protein [Polaribacter glomeratus]PQJ76697.1 hypothetical protein BTO16_12495 [Polaribacter glomeratus]TXD67461.1 GLPGLI family protein [Polaribacter glomeratus]
MKNYIISLILFCSYTNFAQKIEGRITYIASTKKALDNIDNKEKNNFKIKNDIDEIYKKAKDVEVILNFNNLLSEYYVIDKLVIDDYEKINITHIMAGSEKKYYTSNSFSGYNNNTFDCYLLDECFLIENILPKWELMQETKTIQGFECYRAVLKNQKSGNINLEAWYAPKIPYQYGVMNYFGLPGIILELNKNTFKITAIKIELNPVENIIIDKPKEVKQLTQKEFKTLTRKAMPDFYKKQ